MKLFIFSVIIVLFLQPVELWSQQWPVTFTDSAGQKIILETPPERVVSLVPSITELLLRIGAADSVVGITYHSVLPPKTAGKVIIGGFIGPDLERVAELQPDVIFYADLHEKHIARFRNEVTLIRLTPKSIAESFDHIRLLGTLFHKEEKSEEIITDQQRQLQVIALKIAHIPVEKRPRVIRLMGNNPIMVPGDDSFQNEYIRAAGGIATQLGADGNITSISLAQWQQFNPQVIYGCGSPGKSLSALQQPGWRDVDAVRNNHILFFPCELTCRIASRSGLFVSWLSSGIHTDTFSTNDYVLPQGPVSREPLDIDIDYVQQAEIVTSNIKDFQNKTLAISLKRPMKVVSTLEGHKDGIVTVANHYFPPPAWSLDQGQGLAELRETTSRILGFDPDTTSLLFTGADMDNLAVVKKSFLEMEVTALVTAGVEGNSIRSGKDAGNFYEPGKPDNSDGADKPGTINILLLTNMQLSSRAMTRAIISSSEAKSAALQDLDIRSSSSSGYHSATGTGTDNIIVVEGEGTEIDATGGHTKMGELIACAVYAGVQEAIHKQNGLTESRSIFKRLDERNIRLSDIWQTDSQLRSRMERLLLEPRYISFMTAALAISDDFERGLITDLTGFDDWCKIMVTSPGVTTGGHIKNEMAALHDATEIPKVIRKALSVIVIAASS